MVDFSIDMGFKTSLHNENIKIYILYLLEI